jgi:hypothetical protein
MISNKKKYCSNCRSEILQYFYILYILILFNLPNAAAETTSFHQYQKSWELETDFRDIDLSPTGEFIVTLSNSGIEILDTQTGKIRQKIDTLDAFGLYASQIFTNGDYIVVNGRTNLMTIKIFDKNLKPVWEYKDKKNTLDPSRGAISLDGKNIISTYSFQTPNKTLMTILYFFENSELIWKKEFMDFVSDVSITPQGDFILINLAGKDGGIFILDNKGNIIKEFKHQFKTIIMSTDGKYAVGLRESDIKENKAIYFDINNSNKIWEFNYEGVAKSLDQNYDSNITVIGFVNFFYVLSKQGDIAQKSDFDGYVSKIRVTSDGKYFLAAMNSKIAVFSNDIPLMIFPEEKGIVEGSPLKFKWEDNGASSYLLKIDNDIIKADGFEFIQNNSLSNGEHKWSIKAIYDNGKEGMWSYPRKFYYYKDQIPHLTFPDENKGFGSGNITLKWNYFGIAEKYLIDISGTIYNSKNKEITMPFNSFHPGTYRWSVKAVSSDDKESEWSLPGSFYITAPQEKVTQKTVEVTTQINYLYVLIGSITIIGLFAIFIRPFYKRAKLKKQMAKTPTDWCPHCKKFTGGAAICPHCLQNTNIETKYDVPKNRKK